MNTLDNKIIHQLMMNSRYTWARLANDIGISGPSIADRVSKLEEKGIIKGYTAIIDPDLVGYEMLAFVTFSINKKEQREEFIKYIKTLPEVQEYHHIAGERDYILKIRCKDTKDLDRLISEELRELPGIENTKTMIVLNSHKETTNIPIPTD